MKRNLDKGGEVYDNKANVPQPKSKQLKIYFESSTGHIKMSSKLNILDRPLSKGKSEVKKVNLNFAMMMMIRPSSREIIIIIHCL